MDFLHRALAEDVGPGDHTTLATVAENITGRAVCKVKADGVLAGVAFAELLYANVGQGATMEAALPDGSRVAAGEVAFRVAGSMQALLTTERLMLNVLQRMSGIATVTRQVVDAIEGTGCRVLDTRKTTPLFRPFQKWAVLLGGGTNHRYGLFDMVMIKDNHIDAAGGVGAAIASAKKYLATNELALPIEVETRNLNEVQAALQAGGVARILLDNFTPEEIRAAVKIIEGRVETEASGGITLENARAYAETGVDYISMGALTHSAPSLDISLKIDLA